MFFVILTVFDGQMYKENMKTKILIFFKEVFFQLLSLSLAVTYFFLSQIEFDFSKLLVNGFDFHSIYKTIIESNIFKGPSIFISAIIINISVRFLVDDAFISSLLSPLIFLDKNFTDFLHIKSSNFLLISLFLSIPFSIELSSHRRNNLSFLVPFLTSTIICSSSVFSQTPSIMPYVFLGFNFINFIMGKTPTVLHKCLHLLSQLFLTSTIFSIFPRILSQAHERLLHDGMDMASDVASRKRLGLLFDSYANGDNIRLFLVMLLFALTTTSGKHPQVAALAFAALASLVCPQCTSGPRTQEIIIFHLKAYLFLALCLQLSTSRSKLPLLLLSVLALVESTPYICEIERKIF